MVKSVLTAGDPSRRPLTCWAAPGLKRMFVSRRQALTGALSTAAGVAGAAALGGRGWASEYTLEGYNIVLGERPRFAHVHNLHTGESLRATYYENGRYVPDALAELMKVLRDWRSGEEHLMDPRLFDVMHAVRGKLEVAAPFQVISGYRSPATNALMHERSHGVAMNSQHVQGKACDVRLEGVALHQLRAAALDLGAGGVGFYPVSNFVHMDVGPVREWIGV